MLHPRALKYARVGDFATVVNLQNGKIPGALVADLSAPELPVGEESIALAEALGLDASPRRGGTDDDVVHLIYPGFREWQAQATQGDRHQLQSVI